MVKQMSGERMAKLVRGDLEGDGRMLEVFVEGVSDGASREALAKLREEEGAFVDFRCALILLHGGESVGADGNNSLLRSFPHYANAFVLSVNPLHVESREFRKAKTGGVK